MEVYEFTKSMIPINIIMTVTIMCTSAIAISYVILPGIEPIGYYVLHYAQQKLILSNDVELNPGPDYATKQDIKEMNDRLDIVINGIATVNKQWSAVHEQVSGIEARLAENEKQVNGDHEEIKSLSQKIGFLEESLNKTKEKLERAEEQNKKMKRELNDMEDRNKRNNLIFAGIPGDTKETWQESENKVKDIMRNKMKLDVNGIEIERAHRIPNGPTQNGTKPIVVMFAKYKDKEKVMSKTNTLKGTNIYVNQDYCKSTRDIHKILREKRNEIKDYVKNAVVRYKKLVVTDEDGNVSVFEYNEDEKEVVSK